MDLSDIFYSMIMMQLSRKSQRDRDVFALADKALEESERQENKQPLSGAQWTTGR